MKAFDRITTSVVLLFLLMASSASAAQTVKTVANFDITNGAYPGFMAPLQGFDGKLYGGTANGGMNTCTLFGLPFTCGVVFTTTLSGAVTVLHNFDGTDGTSPNGTLVQDVQGNLYGVTQYGGQSDACAPYGANGCGTVFKITPQGAFSSLYSFCSLANCMDGANPFGGLLLGIDGNLYGATAYGGNHVDCAGNGCGTIFKITTTGRLTTLHGFAGTDGSYPYAPLVQSSSGILYGVASGGGTSNAGSIFTITNSGKLTTLHNFSGTDGSDPNPLILATDGNLYGTTTYGGTNTNSMCGINGCGTAFEITSSGELTILYNFCSAANCADGFVPLWSLFQATDGSLYGNTSEYSFTTPVCCGTIFKITATGTFTNLYTFSGADGDFPQGSLMQDTNGTLYGTTGYGGDVGVGNIFRLSEGLHAFVETEPTLGKTGSKITILGDNLKGSTEVSFNGTAATFTVVSNTEITATVPVGATTGYVTVETLKGKLTSNVPFRIQ